MEMKQDKKVLAAQKRAEKAQRVQAIRYVSALFGVILVAVFSGVIVTKDYRSANQSQTSEPKTQYVVKVIPPVNNTPRLASLPSSEFEPGDEGQYENEKTKPKNNPKPKAVYVPKPQPQPVVVSQPVPAPAPVTTSQS